MNHATQPAESEYVLRQTVLKSDLLCVKMDLADNSVRYLMALGLSEGVARVMAKPQTLRMSDSPLVKDEL